MAVSTIYAATLTVLPDGRLMLGAEELSHSESERLRTHLAYGDGSLPAHIGLRETPDGGRELWRIEDGAAAAIPWMPAPDHDSGDDATRPGRTGTRGGFGSARGRYIMTPEFDEPLPEFDEYR
jgi:hypothetical protein